MTTSGPLSRSLAESLKAAALIREDSAAIELARRYTAALDQDLDLLPDLGPKLLAVLTALGLTPAGRGQKGVITGGSVVAAKLDEFTARRARKHGS